MAIVAVRVPIRPRVLSPVWVAIAVAVVAHLVVVAAVVAHLAAVVVADRPAVADAP